MSRSNMVRLDDREYGALQEIKKYHYGSQNVAFGEVVRVLVDTYVRESGVGVEPFDGASHGGGQ